MKSKFFSGILCILLALCNLLTVLSCSAADTQEVLDGILSYELAQDGADSVQDWLDGGLAERAGITAEWYVLALSQDAEHYDFSAYCAALDAYLAENTVTSAVTAQKYALAYLCTGFGDAYIAETMGNSIGEMGIMSWVWGLHLLNNGCEGSPYTAQDAVQTLLDLQLADGGWALMGEQADVDVTAMTLQALAPYYGEYPEEIDKALDLLSEKQLEDGDYAGCGVPNPESTAQVMIALICLGKDPLTDERFVKNENTLLDGIAKYRLPDGSFSHTEHGTGSQNADIQVFFALNALQMDKNPYLLTASGRTASVDYRVIVTICILGAAGIACTVLFLRKNRRTALIVLLLAAAGTAFVWLVQIESAEDYYQPESLADAEITGSVTVAIRCDTVAGRAEHIPENGEILGFTEIPLTQGDTAFDALIRAAKAEGIRIEYSGTPELAYVQGVADLYEYEFGDLSGWVYHVNGASPSVGCGEYILTDGDLVEWLYTCDLGKDVEE